MSDQQVQMLQESQQELVGYVQDYQRRLVEADFATVQATGRAEKAERRAAQLEEQLSEAMRRIAELEPVEEDKPVDEESLLADLAEATEPVKRTPRGK